MKFALKELPTREDLLLLSKKIGPIDIDAVLLVLKFQKTAKDILQKGEKHFASYGISMGKFSIMMLLLRNRKTEGLKPSEIASQTGVTRATVTGLIDGLEKSGYIRRTCADSGDRREIIVCLTPAGLDFLEAMLPDHFRKVSVMMSGLNKEEKYVMLKSLEKLEETVNQYYPEKSQKATEK